MRPRSLARWLIDGQFEKVMAILQDAETAGLMPITGGLGPVADCSEGYFIKPTIFANLNKDQFIAKEEVLAQCWR